MNDDKCPHTPEDFATAGLGDHSYCRNPDNSERIWCYTANPDVRRETCEPKLELKVPSGIAKHMRDESNACKLSKSDCKRLKDRFLVFMAGIVDWTVGRLVPDYQGTV